MPWILGEFSPPSVPGERLPACEGDLRKDELAAAQWRGARNDDVLYGAPAHVSHGHRLLQDKGMQLWLHRTHASPRKTCATPLGFLFLCCFVINSFTNLWKAVTFVAACVAVTNIRKKST